VEYKVCPNNTNSWNNIEVVSTTTPNDCISDPNLYFDKIIDDEYKKGCRIFICEIGRGEDDVTDLHYNILQLYQREYLYLSDDKNDMINKFCIINFGILRREPPHLGKNKIYYTRYIFDEHFIKQFKPWIEEYSKTHNIFIAFIDMTQGNIPPSVLNKVMSGYNVSTHKIEYNKPTGITEIKPEAFSETTVTAFIENGQLNFEYGKDESKFKSKYLKYKFKYLKLKEKTFHK
jgi:hypothetical protein